MTLTFEVHPRGTQFYKIDLIPESFSPKRKGKLNLGKCASVPVTLRRNTIFWHMVRSPLVIREHLFGKSAREGGTF